MDISPRVSNRNGQRSSRASGKLDAMELTEALRTAIGALEYVEQDIQGPGQLRMREARRELEQVMGLMEVVRPEIEPRSDANPPLLLEFCEAFEGLDPPQGWRLSAAIKIAIPRSAASEVIITMTRDDGDAEWSDLVTLEKIIVHGPPDSYAAYRLKALIDCASTTCPDLRDSLRHL